MIKLLAIPAAGTVAAILVILLAHSPRADSEPEPDVPSDTLPQLPGPLLPTPPNDTPDEAPPTPPPQVKEYNLELDAKGGLTDLDTGESFADAAALASSLGEPRHRIVITNGAGVPEAALDAAMAKLQDRYLVRKVYRAPKDEGGK